MKKILIVTVLVVMMMFTFTACSTSTKGRSPADGTWDYVEFWNGGTMIWTNDGDGKVNIDTEESRNHSVTTSEGTWIQYTIKHKNKTFYILDCESLTILYWNE